MDRLRNFKRRSASGLRCEFIFGGDRNFISSPEQRLSSDPTGNWFPGGPTLQAWSEFQAELGAGTVVEQSEFTWQRISSTSNGETRYCKKILDIVGVSLDQGRYLNFSPQSAVVHDMPFPNASDHQPISLMFTDSGRTKPASERGAPKVPFVPEWLLADVEFSAHLTTHVESWKMSRPEGLAGWHREF